MSKLNGIAGTSVADHLLTDPNGAELIAIPMEPGAGTIKRGTVVYRKSSGLWAAAASAQIVNTNLFAVLNENVDTDANAEEGAETTVAENAAAFASGRFIDGRVTLAEDAALSAANKVVLARQGIVFRQSVEHAPEFVNEVANESGDDTSDDTSDNTSEP